jgi:hypothetical protein
MANDAQFNLKTNLSLQTEEFQKGVAAANAQATKMKKNFQSHNKGISDSFKDLGGKIAGVFAVLGAGQLISKMIEVRSTFEKYNAVLTNTLGNSKSAADAMQMLVEIGAQTPFSVDELTGAYVKLVNRGFKPTREEMIKMGDLASSTGKSFDQLVEAILDAQTGQFERLKEFGVRAEKHGNKVSMTFKGVKTEVDYTDKAIQKYLLSLGTLQGVQGSMAAISQTLGGKISNLGDSFDALFNALGEDSSGIMSGVIDGLSNFLKITTDIVKIPMSQKMQEEKIQINAVANALIANNSSLEVRRVLLAKLNQMAPDVAKGLIAEKININALTKSLSEYNKQQLNKIILQQQGEEITKQQAEADRLNNVAAKNILNSNKSADRVFGELVSKGGALKKLAIDAKAIYMARGDISKYFDDLHDAVLKSNDVNIGFSSGEMAVAKSIKGSTDYAEGYLKVVGKLTAEKEKFAKQHGIDLNTDIPLEKSGSGKGSGVGTGNTEKGLTNLQKLYQLSADFKIKLQKEVADDEISRKNAEVNSFIEGEKRKILAIEVTTKAEISERKKVLAELDALKNRMDVGGMYISKMDQILPENAKQTSGERNASRGLSAPLLPSVSNLQLLTKNIKEFAKSRELVDMMSNSFYDLGLTMIDSFKLADTGIQGFAKNILKTIIDLATKIIAVELSKALGVAIGGAVQSGAATGPAAIFTTPAFIATAVGGVLAAFAAIPKFAEGGIVGGSSFTGDRVHAYVNSGEMILNSGQQNRLFGMLNSGSNGSLSGGEVRFEIEGTKLVGVLSNYNRKFKKIA